MIQSLERSTYSNIEVQGTEFVQHCLLPHLKRWEAAISRDLIVDDERYFAEHSVSGLLRGDHASRSAYYVSALQNGWMTINEIRELENLNPIGPEGDKHFVQLNMTTLDHVGESLADQADSATEPLDGTPEDAAEDSTAADQPANQVEDMASTTDLQQQALNGAQVTSLLEIIANLSAGLLTADGAKALISGAFPTMPEATVDSIIAGVNEGVQPAQSQPIGGASNGN
jgi:hypothetical protein